jgi:hypothetical protein
MSPLKLGKLPDRETVKITFAASTELSRLLETYAKAYEAEYGQKETVPGLIPHMLEAFIKADRGFNARRIIPRACQ